MDREPVLVGFVGWFWGEVLEATDVVHDGMTEEHLDLVVRRTVDGPGSWGGDGISLSSFTDACSLVIAVMIAAWCC
jgi:hypothetical protein